MEFFNQRHPNCWQFFKTSFWIAILFVWTSCAFAKSDYGLAIKPVKPTVIIGGSLNLTCTRTNCTKIWFESEFTIPYPQKPLSNTTVMLQLLNVTKKNAGSYTCWCDDQKKGEIPVDATHVYVGVKPKEVTDFSCVYYDFKYLNCSFTYLQNVPMEYTLNYSIFDKFEKCELLHETGNESHYSRFCIINNVIANECNYTFQLTGKFNLSDEQTISQTFNVNIFDQFLPAKIENVESNFSDKDFNASWKYHYYRFYKNYTELEYDIQVTPPYTIGELNVNYDDEKNLYSLYFQLKYANLNYTIAMRSRNKQSVLRTVHNESLWSDWYIQHFKTNPRKPDKAPATPVGAYYNDGKYVTFYWKQLEEYEQNADNFTYFYRLDEQEVGKNIEPNTTFVKLHLPKTTNYADFYIESRNEKGSSHYNKIRFYALKNNSDYNPTNVRAFKENGWYIIKYQPPKNVENLENYTILWCVRKGERKDQCNTTINFVYLNNTNTTTIEFRVESAELLNMAVSANYKNYASGLHWVDCYADIQQHLPQLIITLENIRDTSLDLDLNGFSLCVDEIYIKYCRQPSVENTCATIKPEPVKTHKYSLQNLAPFTNYTIRTIISINKEEVHNEIIATTDETTPSPPTNLTIINITNTTATLIWLPNSQIRYYDLFINNTKTNRTWYEKTYTNNKMLNNLDCYTKYEVYVRAHNKYTSERSKIINFTTSTGTPSKPVNPQYNGASVTWEPSLYANGNLSYYLISTQVEISADKNVSCRNKLDIVPATVLSQNVNCTPDRMIYINLSAVNVIRSNNYSIRNKNSSICHWNNNTATYINNCQDDSNLCLAEKFQNDNFLKSESAKLTPTRCSKQIDLTVLIVSVITVSSIGCLFIAWCLKKKDERKKKEEAITPVLPNGFQNPWGDNMSSENDKIDKMYIAAFNSFSKFLPNPCILRKNSSQAFISSDCQGSFDIIPSTKSTAIDTESENTNISLIESMQDAQQKHDLHNLKMPDDSKKIDDVVGQGGYVNEKGPLQK